MNRTDKRLLRRTVQLGLLLTAVVIALDWLGLLAPFERFLYDTRARYCQFFTPPPTDKIVHLDIDDASLQEIGRFPWPRTRLAEMIDEIRVAGAKVIGLDIIFPEPQETRYEPLPDGSVRAIEDDKNFADAVARAGNVLVPVSTELEQPGRRPELFTAITNLLMQDLELSQAELAAKLRGTSYDTPTLAAQVRQHFLRARDEAMFQRVSMLLELGQQELATVKPQLAPRAHESAQTTDVVHLMEKMLPRAQAVRRLIEFTLPVPPGAPPLLRSNSEQIAFPLLCNAARYSGTVEVVKDPDGIVRSIPLFIEYRGRLMPHMTLAAPCAMLDVPMDQVRIEGGSVVIPVPDAPPIRIPVRTTRSESFGRVGMLMDIPWFGAAGADEWLTMYDPPRHEDSAQHLPLRSVWAVRQFEQDIGKNDSYTDEALYAVDQAYKGTFEKCAAFLARPAVQRSRADRAAAVAETLRDMSGLADIPALQRAKPGELNNDDRKYLITFLALQRAQQTNQKLETQIQKQRAELRAKLEGRYALIAWTAKGVTDFYSTSLHPTCPGGVIQGVVFNAILTRHLWSTPHWWVTLLCTAVIGVATTAIVALWPTKPALLLTILLVAGYAALNGIVFFDWGNGIVGAAGPITAAAVLWFGLTLARFIWEQVERARITDRFRSRVDPAIVRAVIENPDMVRFDGQMKEMTVVFTDLAGFTTLSEKLRERTVPLLNEYMSRMLPIIRANAGIWNKFLGDGIMFFFNAPQDNTRHARDAVFTVLEMQKAMEPFNHRLFERGLPHVAMRAGISTGLMIVGDAGSLDPDNRASDYTVLGDDVNLGARLESANKALGSRVLMNGRTAELLDSEFVLRPMGRLRVVGKTEGVDTFEALCLSRDATDKHQSLAQLSTRVVACFKSAEFQSCIDAARELENAHGSSKFTQLYMYLSKQYLVEPPDTFDGQIVLVEK
jgi:class 3 adenylate cyclase/CHASE2 domain-containing sensor protein